MNDLHNNLNWRDLLDIAVVAIFIYNLLRLIRGTRAVQIINGLLVLLALQGLAYYLKLQTIYFVVHTSVLVIVVAMPIVFQPELRRALMQLGTRSMISPFTAVSRDVLIKIIDEISWAASMLSMTKIGGLIVIERETGLEEFIESGVNVNGEVSSKLLLTIFSPRTPLHDNAVIIRGDKVVAASCILPLSENALNYRDHSYGTRHRAALGLSEQTDAIVVIVSEETGGISIAKDGKLIRDVGEDALKKQLLVFCAAAISTRARSPWMSVRQWLRRWQRTRSTQRLGGVPKMAAENPVVAEPVVPKEREEAATPTRRIPLESLPLEQMPEEAVEIQRRQEEVVHKRAEEAQRRKDQARKAEEEARKAEADDEASGSQEKPAESAEDALRP